MIKYLFNKMSCMCIVHDKMIYLEEDSKNNKRDNFIIL